MQLARVRTRTQSRAVRPRVGLEAASCPGRAHDKGDTQPCLGSPQTRTGPCPSARCIYSSFIPTHARLLSRSGKADMRESEVGGVDREREGGSESRARGLPASTRGHTRPHARTHNGFHFLRCPPAFMNISGFVTSIAAAYKAFRHGDNFTR